VRPEVPSNIGAVARVIRNTGLDALTLVSPGDWRTVECWRTAWGAHEVLETAVVVPTLEEALAGATYVAALSGKRSGPSPPIDVREAATELATVPGDEVAALVFGPEDIGLTHEEIALCGRRVWIPAHPAQPSLNLSHAVMVASYEVLRARRPPGELRHRARHEEKQAMIRLLRQGLQALRALPPQNQEGYFLEWEAIFSRADLTPREVRLLEHMSRKMIARGGRGDEDAAEGGGRDRIK
jgi:TrmH family RNA methyltransferase